MAAVKQISVAASASEWTRPSLFLAIALLVIACARTPPPDLRIDAVATAGRSATWRSAYEERLRAATSQPHSPRARGELAKFLQANDEPAAAKSLYEQLTLADPKEGRWPYYLARLVQDDGQTDRARTLLHDAEQRSPDYPLITFRRAELHLKSGAIDAAETDYQAFASRQPAIPHAWLGLARIAMQRGNPREAEKQLLLALQRDPAFASAQALLATVRESLGETANTFRPPPLATDSHRYREPEDPWLNELAPFCVDPEKLSVLADIALESGATPRAIALLEQSRRLEPGRARTHLELGKARARSGERVAARERFVEAIRLDPTLAEAHHALAAAWEAEGQVARALETADAATRANPAHAGLQRQRGILLQAARREREAEPVLRRAVELDGGDVANVEALGNFLWAEGRRDEAVRLFERARSLSRLAAKPRALLGGYHLERGAFAEAERCLDEAAEVEPHLEGLAALRSLVHVRRATAAFRAGQPGPAEAELKKALTLQRDHEEAVTNLVAIWTRTSRTADARAFLETFLAEHPQAAFGYGLAARVAAQAGDRVRAATLVDRGLDVARAQRDQRQEAALSVLREQLRGPWQAPPTRTAP